MAPKKVITTDNTPTAFTEVEKQFYELELTDCNRKVARLRQNKAEYEKRNEELQIAYNKLDEEKSDIIEYLKKKANVLNDECSELKERVKGLEEIREKEKMQFKKTVFELEKDFTTMKDQLTIENKLYSGKINALEEFRVMKSDLMHKFDNLHRAFLDQELKFKRKLYDTEKKFILGKDRLKREMEDKLSQLAQDFQDASESRIAASTHRVIRENIALNNELDTLLATQSKIANQNESYKYQEESARLRMEMAEEERDKAINKSVVQLKVIERLTKAYEDLKSDRAVYDKRLKDYEEIQHKLNTFMKENGSLTLKVRILEQNLHCKLSEQNKTLVETTRILSECDRYRKILIEGELACLHALKLIQWKKTSSSECDGSDKFEIHEVIHEILSTIIMYRDVGQAESTESLISLSNIYEKGDLGFIPKISLHKVTKNVPLTVTSSVLSVPSDIIEDKTSTQSVPEMTESVASFDTVPTIQVMPPVGKEEPAASKHSLGSFASSASSRTHESSSSAEPTETTDMEKKLIQSKIAIQKSLMKDLMISQTFKAPSRRGSMKLMTPRESLVQVAERKSVVFLNNDDGNLEGGDNKSSDHESDAKRQSVVFQDSPTILDEPDRPNNEEVVEENQQGVNSPTKDEHK